jgi:hypothetical protein
MRIAGAGTGNTSQPCLGLEACLRPLRRIDISQLVNGQPINGTTVQVQVPIPDNPYAWKLPPTNTAILILMLEADFSTPTKNVITLIMTE